MDKNIVMVIAPENFRDEEYLVPKEIFEKEGIKVTTASKGVKTAVGKLGARVKVDIDICEIDSTDFSAIVLVGGPGALNYKMDSILAKILEDFYMEDKLISAICIAPVILAQNRILRRKKATVWSDESRETIKFIEQKEAIYVDMLVVEDENLITANGPAAAEEFAEKIIEHLSKIPN